MSDYEVTAKQVDPLRVAVLRDTIESYAKVGRLFKELRQILEAQGITPVGPQLAIYFDKDYKPHDVDVALAVPVGGDATLPKDGRAGISDLPGGTMVSLVRQGPWDDFRPAYEAIMAWVQANGYQIAGPNREIHVQGPGSGVPPEQYLMEIQFPITKR